MAFQGTSMVRTTYRTPISLNRPRQNMERFHVLQLHLHSKSFLINNLRPYVLPCFAYLIYLQTFLVSSKHV